MIGAIYKVTKRWLDRVKVTAEDIFCSLEDFYQWLDPDADYDIPSDNSEEESSIKTLKV